MSDTKLEEQYCAECGDEKEQANKVFCDACLKRLGDTKVVDYKAKPKRKETVGLAATCFVYKLWELEELVRYATPEKPMPDELVERSRKALAAIADDIKATLKLNPQAPKVW